MGPDCYRPDVPQLRIISACYTSGVHVGLTVLYEENEVQQVRAARCFLVATSTVDFLEWQLQEGRRCLEQHRSVIYSYARAYLQP